MDAITQDDGASAEAALAARKSFIIVTTSAASAPRSSLLMIVILMAVIMCFLVQPSFVLPVSTSTTESTPETISMSAKSAKYRHQNQFQRRGDFGAAEIYTIIFCCIVGVGLSWLLVSLVLTCAVKCVGSDGTRTRQEGKDQGITETTVEEVSNATASGLRRDNGRQSWHEQPNSSIGHIEMQRIREVELRLSRGITQLQPVAKPPTYQSEEELPPYATTSRPDQVPQYPDTVIEMPRMTFTRIN